MKEMTESFLKKEQRVENKFNMLIEAFSSGKLKPEKVKELMGK